MRRPLLVATGVAAAALARCDSSVGPARRDDSPLQESSRAGEIVVARVDGVPILASDVSRQARLAGTPPRVALESLIDMEILAAEAGRRGMAAAPEAIDIARRASVGRLIEEAFERGSLPDTVPEAELLARYEQQKRRFVRPEVRRVVHALLAASESSSEVERRAAEARAHALAEAAAGRALDAVTFRALVDEASVAGMQFHLEELGTSRTGDTVEPFARAAFEIERPDSTSGVVATSFGYHVILLVAIEPALDQSFADARAQILQEVRHESRMRAFERFMSDLERDHSAVINPAPLLSPREG